MRLTHIQSFWGGFSIQKNGCWEWRRALHPSGYGMLTAISRKGMERAHRAAYEIVNGPIPKGLCVLHRCDNRKCCNPLHLFLGTRMDNAVDAIQKGRHVMPPVLHGSRNSAAKLSQMEVDEIRRRYALGGVLQRELGVKYGVSQVLIGLIVNGKVWKETPCGI